MSHIPPENNDIVQFFSQEINAISQVEVNNNLNE